MMMARLTRPVLPILAAIPLVGIATGGLFPLISLELDRLGFSGSVIGFATALYYAGSFLGALSYGWVVGRLGLVGAYSLAASGLALSSLMLTTTGDAALWTVLRFLGGYLLGGLYVVTDGWVSSKAGPDGRGRVFAVYETLRLGAVALGPSLILLGSTTAGFWLVAVFYGLSILPVLIGDTGASARPDRRHLSGLAEIVRCFPRTLVIGLCGGACNAAFYGLGPVYAVGIGLDRPAVAVFAATVLFAPIVAQLPAGLLSDRVGRMMTATLLAGIALGAAVVVLALPPSTLSAALPPAFLFALATVPLYGMALNRVSDHLGTGEPVAASTATMVSYSVGGAIGPLAAGLAMDALGPPGLYLTLGSLAAVAAVAAAVERFFPRCCPEGAGCA